MNKSKQIGQVKRDSISRLDFSARSLEVDDIIFGCFLSLIVLYISLFSWSKNHITRSFRFLGIFLEILSLILTQYSVKYSRE